MGAVQEFNFGDFKNEILSKLGVGSRALESRTNINLIKSIFDSAAKNDGGENAELLETDMKDFQKLVDNTISALKNEGDKCWMEKILGSKLYQLFFPRPQNETEDVELVKVEAGLAESVQDKPNSEYGEIKKLETPSKEEMLSKLNKYLETPLGPDATEEEFLAALKEVAEKQQEVAKTQQETLERLQALRDKEVELVKVEAGLAKNIQDKPNSEYGVIKKLEMPSREEMISRLNKYLETPLSPEATVEEIRVALKEVAKQQQEVAEIQQEALERLQSLRDKEVEPFEPHFGLD